MFKSHNVIFFATIILLLSGCQSSSVGNSDLALGQRQIAGRVSLGSNLSPEGVFVWLEGFDFGARTDVNGDFQFTLPPATLQPGGGVSGAFQLYFYMANFRLDALTVIVNHGEFIYTPGVFTDSGELTQTRFLSPLLDIEVRPIPESAQQTDAVILTTRIFLRTTFSDTVFVFMPQNVNGVLNPLIYSRQDVQQVRVFGSTNAGFTPGDTLAITNDGPVELIRLLTGGPPDLEVGRYEIVPFLFVLNNIVPEGLLRSLGSNLDQLGAGYLQLPFRRRTTIFEISSPPSP